MDNKNAENSCPGYPQHTRPVSHGKFGRAKSSGNNGTDILGFSIDTSEVVTLIPPLDFSNLKPLDIDWWSPLPSNSNEVDDSLENIVAKGELAKYLVEVERPKPPHPTLYDRDPVSDFPDVEVIPQATACTR